MAGQISDMVLIGAGRLGSQLGHAFVGANLPIRQVFSRKVSKTAGFGVPGIDTFDQVLPNAQLYIIAVPDGVINEVAQQLSNYIAPDALVVHTSGATPAQVLSEYFDRFGVFYPLQSFSAGREIDFSQIPFCLHAQNSSDLQALTAIAKALSPNIYYLDDKQRAVLHVAAVWANNFSNHLFTIAEELLRDTRLPFDLLRPLILETAQKVQQNPPGAMQTGPAARGDRVTIERHLEYLKKYPAYSLLYRQLTASINRDLNTSVFGEDDQSNK